MRYWLAVGLVIAVLVRQYIMVGENRRLLEQVADQALRDPLTGLANRMLFHDRLTHALQLHQRDNQSVTVLSLDLDDFKLVNDNLGHPAGVGDYAAAAWFAASMATVVGAIGSGLENDEEVRETISRYRPRTRPGSRCEPRE